MRPAPFAEPGRFFRGNLHTHSNLSDGALEPGEVCRRYAAEGYDFLCLSDHFVGRYGYPIADTTPFRTNSFTTILGAEVHSGKLANGELWHLLAVGLPRDFAPSDSPDFDPVEGQETGAALAARCREAGAFVAIAHPEWYGLTPEDARTIDAAHAVEIYNHSCAIETDRGAGTAIVDHLLADGRRLTLCATDDAHFRGSSPDHFGGWVMVKAAENDPDALLESLKSGHYYSSQGPEIRDIEVGREEVHIACSPAAHVIAVGQNAASASVDGRAMTRATLPLERFRRHGWLRIVVIDGAGKRAWSNPVWLD